MQEKAGGHRPPLQLRHQHYRRLPERYLLPGGIQNRYLAVVFAGRKLSERETEL